MARRESAKQLIAKFGDVARHSINVGARAERRAVRTFVRGEERKSRTAPMKVSGKRLTLAEERRIAYLDGRNRAMFDVLGWLGGRIWRTRKPGGVGKK